MKITRKELREIAQPVIALTFILLYLLSWVMSVIQAPNLSEALLHLYTLGILSFLQNFSLVFKTFQSLFLG